MDQQDPYPCLPPFSFRDPAAAVAELEAILDDVEGFLAQWCDRVATLAPPGAAPQQALKKQIAVFNTERARWEAKQASELRELRRKADHLAEAWLRLESEQRRLMQASDGLGRQRQASNPAASSSLVIAHGGPPRREVQPRTSIAAKPRSISPSSGEDSTMTVHQFEQLHQEMCLCRKESRDF